MGQCDKVDKIIFLLVVQSEVTCLTKKRAAGDTSDVTQFYCDLNEEETWIK